MTSGAGTSGNEPVTAPGIHDETVTPAAPPFTQPQLFGIGQAMLNGIAAFVLYALAGIQVFGVAPFGFLRSWADELSQRADDAFNGAVVAQGSADTANTGVLLLNNRVNEIVNGGESFYDTFGRDLADFSTDPDYDVVIAGGSGNLFLTLADDGRLRWNAVGFSDTEFIARRLTPMGGNRVHMGTVIDGFTTQFTVNDAHIKLMARMDDTRQNYIVATIANIASVGGRAEIGYVLAGVYTRLGAQEAVTTSTGDFWDLEVGNGSDEWRFRLSQNNTVRVDRTDLGHVSQIDTVPDVTTGVYKFCAIGGDCAVGAGFFGTTYQIGMPDFQVIAGGEF